MPTDSLIRRLGSSLRHAIVGDEEEVFDGERVELDVEPVSGWQVEERLVEAETALQGVAQSTTLDRVWRTALRAKPDDGKPWPNANPAFVETLFMELLKVSQFERAFALLSRECRAAWSSPQEFAQSLEHQGLTRVSAMEVRECQFLEAWEDAAHGATFEHVAELRVEYAFAFKGTLHRMNKTVHVVAEDGMWKCLYFPQK